MNAFVLVVVAVALGAALFISWPLLRTAPVRQARWLAAACLPVALGGVWLALRQSPADPVPAPVVGLERARAGPDDGQAWVKRARSLAEAGRFAEAATAYEEAGKRLPHNAAVLAERADTLAMSRGRRFDGEPDRLIAQALAIDPRQVKALALSGTSAYTRGDFAAAARQWRALLAVLPPDGAMAKEVAERQADAERRSRQGG